MNEFIYFVAFISLAGFSAALYEAEVKKLQGRPSLARDDATIDSTLSQDFYQVPEDVIELAVTKMRNEDGRSLEAGLLSSFARKKYSVKLTGESRTRNVYAAPLGSPARLWATYKGYDSSRCANHWILFYT